MALLVVYRSDEVDLAGYKDIIKQTAGDLPVGVLAHFAGFGDGKGFCVVDVWEAREYYEEFIPKLQAVLESLGVTYPEPEVYELEGLIATPAVVPFSVQLAPV